jgi:hypothetical protein
MESLGTAGLKQQKKARDPTLLIPLAEIVSNDRIKQQILLY